MTPIPIALSTGSLYTYGIARVFELAAQAGFDGVEVLMDHRWDGRQPAYLRRVSRDTGMPIVAVHNPFVPHVPGWPTDSLGRLRASAAVAREVGAPLVVAHLPMRMLAVKVELFGARLKPLLLPVPWPLRDGDYRRLFLHDLPAFEAAEGVRVGVENMPAKRLLGFRVDFGGFTLVSDFQTNLDASVTYHINDWLFANLGYRALYDNYESGSGANRFKYDVWAYGPWLGFGVRF